MRAMEKLYVVVRADLSVGLQCAQAVHAAVKFAHEHREQETAWYFGSNNIVILHAADEVALLDLVARAEAAGIAVATFREPDLGDSATACAFEPKARKLLQKIKLAA